MSELETLFGAMTVGDLCNKASISVSTLMQRVLEPSAATSAYTMQASVAAIYRDGHKAIKEGAKRADKAKMRASQSKPKASGSGKTIGNLASPVERERFDNAILEILRSSSGPQKIDEILRHMPWTNVSRDQVSRAMPRLRDEGKITANGRTQARVYALTKN